MSAATTAAIAAAAAARKRREEEEQMTTYRPEELSQDWEFKILRSACGAFKNPTFQQQCLAEEAQAGWTLVEKFDNSRLRLKRPAAARERDGKLAFDPYRTSVGASETAVALWIVAITLGISIGVIAAIVVLVSAAS
jgi:hypothetical protein